MKTLEIRRHSIRSGQNLSEQGIHLARLLGEEMGRFDRVITSPLPRAVQTAVAMGFTVDETSELLSSTTVPVELECAWPAGFSEYALAIRQLGATYQFARKLANFYQKLVQSLPEDGRALVINHGGVVELSAAACLPETDLTFLGDYVEYCEGVRLTWEDGAFTQAEILRV